MYLQVGPSSARRSNDDRLQFVTFGLYLRQSMVNETLNSKFQSEIDNF